MSIDRRHFLAATAATGAFTATEAIAAPGRIEHRAGLGPRRRCRPSRRPLQRQRRPDRGAAARDRPHRRRAAAADPRARRLSRARPRAADRRAADRRAGRNAHRRDRQRAADRRARRRPHPALRHHLRRQRQGAARAMPASIQLAAGRGIAIRDCEVIGAGRNGIVLEGIEGEVTGTTITGALGAAIHRARCARR